MVDLAKTRTPETLQRRHAIAREVWTFGSGQAGRIEDHLELSEHDLSETAPKAEELAADLEKLGPTFIKLGQLLSTRADLLPSPYLEALTRLQDRVEPFAYEEVDRIVSGEIGVRISKAFAVISIRNRSLPPRWPRCTGASMRDGREGCGQSAAAEHSRTDRRGSRSTGSNCPFLMRIPNSASATILRTC